MKTYDAIGGHLRITHSTIDQVYETCHSKTRGMEVSRSLATQPTEQSQNRNNIVPAAGKATSRTLGADAVLTHDRRVQTRPFTQHPELVSARGTSRAPVTRNRRSQNHRANCCFASVVGGSALAGSAVLFLVVGLPVLSEHYGWAGSTKAAERADDNAAYEADMANYLISVRNTPPGAPRPIAPTRASSAAARSASSSSSPSRSSPSSASASSARGSSSSSSSSSKGRRLHDELFMPAARILAEADLACLREASNLRNVRKAQSKAAHFGEDRKTAQMPTRTYSRRNALHLR